MPRKRWLCRVNKLDGRQILCPGVASGWQGALEGSVVTCPWHAWEFDSATGACVFNAELKVPAYPARVEDGQIVVDLPEHA